MTRFVGAYPVLPTPFHDDGTIDLVSLRRTVDHVVDAGAAGVVCFGLASEVGELTDAERAAILAAVIDQVAGRCTVIAGSEHGSVDGAVRRASAAADAGAHALMSYPPRAEPARIVDYYDALVAATQRPVIVQDAPAWTGVDLDEEILTEIATRVPEAAHVKVECPPTAVKMAHLRTHGIECLGGFGTLYLAEELRTGLTATMPGSADAGAVADILALHFAGGTADAEKRCIRRLPLTVFAMTSLDTFIAVQKWILWRRGVLACAHVRRPGCQLVDLQVAWLEHLLETSDVSEPVAVDVG